MGRGELEAMIARGQVETIPIEFGCVIPTREVERLHQARSCDVRGSRRGSSEQLAASTTSKRSPPGIRTAWRGGRRIASSTGCLHALVFGAGCGDGDSRAAR
jgi:hypothetical protein